MSADDEAVTAPGRALVANMSCHDTEILASVGAEYGAIGRVGIPPIVRAYPCTRRPFSAFFTTEAHAEKLQHDFVPLPWANLGR